MLGLHSLLCLIVIQIKIILSQKMSFYFSNNILISPWLFWHFFFLRYEKSCFFFLNKRNVSYPASLMSWTYALSACWVIHTGWHLGLLLDQEMLSALGCAEWRHSNKIMNVFCVHLWAKSLPYPFPNPVSNGLFLKVQFRFSLLQIIHSVGFLYLKLSWGTVVFEAQNDMKSQVKKKKRQT